MPGTPLLCPPPPAAPVSLVPFLNRLFRVSGPWSFGGGAEESEESEEAGEAVVAALLVGYV